MSGLPRTLVAAAGLAALLTAATATGAASSGAADSPIDPGRAMAESRAAIGTEPRNFDFTDADGKRVSLASLRGKPLIVSFVYTGCSQVCPTTTRFLAKAVREARKVVGAADFRVVSIGFNIPSDNPMSMRLFARQNGIDDPLWLFLTPDPGAPEALAKDFGFAFASRTGGFDHLSQVTVLDARGRLHAQVYGESFELPMLVQPLRELVLGEPVTVPTVAGWVERVRLVCTVYDPLSGKYRLDYALFIELAVGVTCLALTLWYVLRGWRRARLAR